MEFRPCIDIHDGKVKQIVGGSLNDGKGAKENFVSVYDALFYASYYRNKGINGGHVIILNKQGTPEYELSHNEAMNALSSYPGGLQIGGGVNDKNAVEYIEAGASHCIVTSFVFRDGIIDYDRLKSLVNAVGREHIVLDLSCRKKDDAYYIVTDRWQKFTDVRLTVDTLKELEQYADEYLVHGVDVEGKQSGVDNELIEILGSYAASGIKVTYAGGIHDYKDVKLIKQLTDGNVNITVGSSLNLFGGSMDLDRIVEICKQ